MPAHVDTSDMFIEKMRKVSKARKGLPSFSSKKLKMGYQELILHKSDNRWETETGDSCRGPDKR